MSRVLKLDLGTSQSLASSQRDVSLLLDINNLQGRLIRLYLWLLPTKINRHF